MLPPLHHQRASSFVHHGSRPGLVLGAGSQVRDGHFYGLDLIEFGGDAADLVADLISLHWDVLALDAGGREEGARRLIFTLTRELESSSHHHLKKTTTW